MAHPRADGSGTPRRHRALREFSMDHLTRGLVSHLRRVHYSGCADADATWHSRGSLSLAAHECPARYTARQEEEFVPRFN